MMHSIGRLRKENDKPSCTVYFQGLNVYAVRETHHTISFPTVVPTKSDSDVILCLQ